MSMTFQLSTLATIFASLYEQLQQEMDILYWLFPDSTDSGNPVL